MSDSAAEAVETCAWCEKPSVTHVIVVPGRKRKKTKPVCEEHATRFEGQGQTTRRLEIEQQMERERKRSLWKGRQGWR